MKIRTDSSGQLVGFSHHDGRLFSLSWCGEKDIQVAIRSYNGTLYTIQLTGVSLFAGNNVMEGNIIDRAYAWHASSAPRDALARLAERTSMTTDELLSRRHVGDQVLMCIDSSYGAEIISLSDDVVVIDEEGSACQVEFYPGSVSS